MALESRPECSGKVSDATLVCPHCGHPMKPQDSPCTPAKQFLEIKRATGAQIWVLRWKDARAEVVSADEPESACARIDGRRREEPLSELSPSRGVRGHPTLPADPWARNP